MSFVSLDCTYTGSKIDDSSTQFLFIFLFNACLYLYFYIYTVYLDRFDANDVLCYRSGLFAFSLFTCENVIFEYCLIRHIVCFSLLPQQEHSPSLLSVFF